MADEIITDNAGVITQEQNPDDKLAAEILKKKINAFNEFRKSRLLEMKANVAYLVGHQNIEVKNNTIVPISDAFATEVVANKILPAVCNDIAVATKTSIKWDIVPASTDEEDKATAKAADNIVPYLLRINRFNEQRKSIVLWYDISGIGWRKVYWNPFYKVIGRNPVAGREGYNPQLEPGEPIFFGEVVSEHIPNTELIYDWRMKNPHKLKWIIHAKTITLGEVKQRYGKDIAAKVTNVARDKNDDKDSFEVEIMGQFAELSQTIAPLNPKTRETLLEDDKIVNYYEFWHIVDGNMPVGSYMEAVGNVGNLVIAVNKPYPIEQYPHGRLPFIPYDPLALDGISVGAPSRISQARPLQRYYNKILCLIADNIDALGNSVIIASRGANIDYKKMDSGAGNIIEVDGSYITGVRREPGVPIPGSLFAFIDVIAKMIDEIFAFHEPSKGIMPEGGPRSAIGLQVLQEADATQLSPIIRSFDDSDEEAINQMISLAVANYNERLIEIVGRDNEWTLEKIDPVQLHGKVNVKVRTGSSIPINKTLEQEKAFMAWQSQLLGNPLDPTIRQKVLKAMDLTGFDSLLQDTSKHINLAQKEFIQAEKVALEMPPLPENASEDMIESLMSQYVFIPPANQFDDHYAHSIEHTNFLIDKYYKYITGPPHLRALAMAMIAHLTQHQQIIQMMQLQTAMLANPQAFKEDKETKKEK